MGGPWGYYPDSFSCEGEMFTFGGRPVNLMGYVTQGGAFSLVSDKYDSEEGLQSALMNLFLEGDYSIANNLKFYASGMLTVDWIYQFKSGDHSWDDKLFTKSKKYLNVDDDILATLEGSAPDLDP